MQSRLIVKNFGPIKHVDLDLRNVNVFIGPQASGKSALAKLFTIFKAPRKFLKNGNTEANLKAFKDTLEEYNIQSFLKEDSEIEFESELHDLSYKNQIIFYDAKLLNRIDNLLQLNQNFPANKETIINDLGNLFDNHLLIFGKVKKLPNFETNEETLIKTIEIVKEAESYLASKASMYIPSERSFINIVMGSINNLILNNVPIPKHILFFGAELEKAIVTEIDLGFLNENTVYRNINGEGRIYKDKEYGIKLTEAASGMQSVVPLLIPILGHDILSYQHSFVIEEPELNLFPDAQYGLIKYLESLRPEPYWQDVGVLHTYTTHSPYILSGLNNLLYAYKVSQSLKIHVPDSDRILDEINHLAKPVEEIVSTEINPNSFSAYQIKNGTAESIVDRSTGLLKENYIDAASDKMTDDFEALMELMK